MRVIIRDCARSAHITIRYNNCLLMARKMSFEESFDSPSSPICVPENFDDWSVRPMPLDPSKVGKRTAFWDNFHGSPTVVGRLHSNACEDECIAYTKAPLPVGAAWKITILEVSDKWERALTIGLTDTKPEQVPRALPLVNFNQQQNFNHEIKYEKQDDEPRDVRKRVNTLTRTLPLLWDTTVSSTLCLLLTNNGQLHIYLDREYNRKLGSRLPINVPLWGNVDVFGRCVKVKSELLLPRELEEALGLPPCQRDISLPPMPCFDSAPEKIEVKNLEQSVGVAPRGMGVMVKIPPEAMDHPEVPTTMSFATCSPKGSYDFPKGYKPLGPVYYISSNKQLTKEVEVLAEHNADITTEDEAREMIFCMAKPPQDGSDTIHFIPVPAGEFQRDEDQGKLITNQLGFISAGTKEAQTSKIKKRYAVMCCYTNEDGNNQNVALSMSIANQVYMTNFKRAMERTWKRSLFNISRVPVSFSGSISKASVKFEEVQGWTIIADTQHCDFTSEMVEYDERDDVGEEHYPPRYIFTIRATDTAMCTYLSYEVTGFTRDVNFQVPLNPRRQCITQDEVESKPNLILLQKFGDMKIIEESAPHYADIGRRLLDDKHGNRVRAIEMDKYTTIERMTEIYTKWLTEDRYHTWATLCECFRYCELDTLAEKIEMQLGVSSPAFYNGDRLPSTNRPKKIIQFIREWFGWS